MQNGFYAVLGPNIFGGRFTGTARFGGKLREKGPEHDEDEVSSQSHALRLPLRM